MRVSSIRPEARPPDQHSRSSKNFECQRSTLVTDPCAMSATSEERFFDPVDKLPRSESTELRWQTSATDSSKVVARAFVAIDVDSLCSLLFSPQSAFAVSQSCLTAKSPPPPAVRCPRVRLRCVFPDRRSCARICPAVDPFPQSEEELGLY
jgi:hypothetical protein